MRNRTTCSSMPSRFWRVAFFCGLACGAFVSVPAESAQTEGQASPRDLLIDTSDADWQSLSADRVFDSSQPQLLRIMRRLTQIDRTLLQRMAEKEALPKPGDPPPTGRLFEVRGDVTEIRAVNLPANAERSTSELDYYLVKIALDSQSAAWVACNEIPLAWTSATPTSNTHCSCPAYFLKWVDDAGTTAPLLAGRRLAWYPDQATSGVSAGRAWLGKAGVDVGTLDLVEKRSGQSLDREEIACLMQMIAMSDAAFAQNTQWPNFDVVHLLQQPSGQAGGAFSLLGTVHRVTPVELAENAYARWLGLDRYYQLDMFVSLGDRRLNLVDKNKSGEFSYEQDFPVTVVVAHLPAGLSVGEHGGTLVRLPVFLFRLWSYPSLMTRRVNPNARQVAPLLVGGPIELIIADSRPFATTVTAFVIACTALLALFGFWIWRKSRRERLRRPSLPPKIDLSSAGS